MTKPKSDEEIVAEIKTWNKAIHYPFRVCRMCGEEKWCARVVRPKKPGQLRDYVRFICEDCFNTNPLEKVYCKKLAEATL